MGKYGGFFEEYMNSIYSKSNTLTPEQYEKAAEAFDRAYRRYLPVDTNAAILDIGSGAGHFLYFLNKKGYLNYMGVDASSQQVSFCRENITDRVEQADVRDFLANSKERYDLITAHDLLEHIPKIDILPLIQQVFCALKPGGIFIVRVPNMSNPFSLDSRYCDFTHEVGFTEKSLYQVLWVGGFRDINILPYEGFRIRSFRNFVRSVMIQAFYSLLRFLFYIQDIQGQKNLGVKLTAVSKKI